VKKVRTLERKLAKEQRETMRVRATRARDAVERSEMEDFFMQCVEVRDVVKPHVTLPAILQESNDGRMFHATYFDAKPPNSVLPS